MLAQTIKEVDEILASTEAKLGVIAATLMQEFCRLVKTAGGELSDEDIGSTLIIPAHDSEDLVRIVKARINGKNQLIVSGFYIDDPDDQVTDGDAMTMTELQLIDLPAEIIMEVIRHFSQCAKAELFPGELDSPE